VGGRMETERAAGDFGELGAALGPI